jgi:transcriptional regulator of arginine metabolism
MPLRYVISFGTRVTPQEHGLVEKARRQDALLRLIQEREVANQHEIVRWLRKTGVSATQASISRDIRELGLVKVGGRYVPSDGLIDREAAVRSPVAENGLITGYEPVGANLVIVRTRIGAASAVAVELDRLHARDIAGTIAGDDTIFVAIRSRSAQGRVVSLLSAMRRESR